MMKLSSLKGAVRGKPSSSRPEENGLDFEPGKLGTVRSYSSGSELLQQDTPADAVYFIREGFVKLVWRESKGKESIVGLRGRGWFLGAASVITSSLCPVSAIVLTRSIIERIPAEDFVDRVRGDPELTWKLHQIQSQELCEQFSWLGELACCSARIRLMNLLIRLTASHDKNSENRNRRLRLPLKRTDIAELIAVTPEHLSRLLRQLSREGQLDLSNGWIVVSETQ